ncbi:MAG TPA: pyridoxamine 5'-phosphate oxidase [Actinomycetota bacterium]|nr:pyridoxamine 5'-phosphate oxidase [Actinomycetota bacterium]
MTAFSHPDRPLERDDLLADPIAQTARWLADAEAADIPLANAIALATADADGAPAARHVLLRTVDERGFVFYTNRESRKGRHLAANPQVAFTVLWRELDRQIGVTGTAVPVEDDASDAYFATRPREAKIGAWASAQSAVLPDRATLERQVETATARFGDGEIPRPPYWGGYLVVPDTIEFWQGRDFRLHDRFRYTRDAGEPSGWRVERLSP